MKKITEKNEQTLHYWHWCVSADRWRLEWRYVRQTSQVFS